MIIDTNKMDKRKVITGVVFLIPLMLLVAFGVYLCMVGHGIILELIIVLMPIILFVMLAFITLLGIGLIEEGLKG